MLKRLKRAFQELFKSNDKIRHTFDDQDRVLAVEMRRVNQETKRIRAEMELQKAKADLEELKSELWEDEEEDQDQDFEANNPEKLLTALLTKALMQGKGPQVSEPPPMVTPANQGLNIPPEWLEKARNMPKKELLKFIDKNYELIRERLP